MSELLWVIFADEFCPRPAPIHIAHWHACRRWRPFWNTTPTSSWTRPTKRRSRCSALPAPFLSGRPPSPPSHDLTLTSMPQARRSHLLDRLTTTVPRYPAVLLSLLCWLCVYPHILHVLPTDYLVYAAVYRGAVFYFHTTTYSMQRFPLYRRTLLVVSDSGAGSSLLKTTVFGYDHVLVCTCNTILLVLASIVPHRMAVHIQVAHLHQASLYALQGLGEASSS